MQPRNSAASNRQGARYHLGSETAHLPRGERFSSFGSLDRQRGVPADRAWYLCRATRAHRTVLSTGGPCIERGELEIRQGILAGEKPILGIGHQDIRFGKARFHVVIGKSKVMIAMKMRQYRPVDGSGIDSCCG
jgi:hypothetical protein